MLLRLPGFSICSSDFLLSPKARKMGLLGLLAFPQHIKNRPEKPAFRVKIPRETDFLPLGEKPGLLHVVAELPEKGGVKRLT